MASVAEYAIDTLEDCAYRDVGLSATEAVDPPFTYHYCRSVFDWSFDREVLAALCEWVHIGNINFDGLETGLTAVYVVECGDAPFVKIGLSDNPAWRLAGLQTANWQPLRLHAVLWVWEGRAKELEAACHRRAVKQGLELRGEWVRATADDAIDLVLAQAAEMDLQASGSTGVMRSRNDAISCRSHALKTARRLQAEKRAASQGY